MQRGRTRSPARHYRLTAAERLLETELKRRGVEAPGQQRVERERWTYGAPEIVSAISLFLVLRHFLLKDPSRPSAPHRISVRDCHSTARAFDLSENDVCRCVATFMRRLGRRSLEDAYTTQAEPLAPRVVEVLREALLWLSESSHVWLPRR